MTHPECTTRPRPTAKRAIIAGYLPDQAATTTKILESLGFEVGAVVNGSEVLRHCRQDPPDVVLLDLHAADRTGLAWIRDLRALSSEIPKIIFTAPNCALEAIWQALGLGAHEYILRPFSRAALREKLGTVGISVIPSCAH